MRAVAGGLRPGQRVQVGYSFLQMAAAREALAAVGGREFGDPVHFTARYLHSGYLDRGYRDRRRGPLQPAPVGGVTADLGSHLFSFLVAYLGPDLEVLAAAQSGAFPDVPPESELCMTALLRHASSGAVGTIQASRISAGAGELLELELRFTRGALRFSTDRFRWPGADRRQEGPLARCPDQAPGQEQQAEKVGQVRADAAYRACWGRGTGKWCGAR